MIPPANGAATGAATDIVHRIARAVGHFVSRSNTGQAFAGTAPVGALFMTQNGKLTQHFCTASVVHSPGGDLAVTAAHCVTGVGSSIAFVPDYDNGKEPFGVWQVTHVYTDKAWQSSGSADDDFAFLQLSPTGQSSPIEDITGAEVLGTRGQSHALVQVVGYPDTTGHPVVCESWAEGFSSTQLEFDCDGYTNGTSGGPFLASVSNSTGQGIVIGVIGGYQQGGDTPSVSYSAVFGPRVAALYQVAIGSG